MRRGFISGIVISLFVAFATFMYTSVSAAQNNDSSPTPSTSFNQAVSTVATPSYVALGDSVAAGLGLPLVDNATSQDRRCGRSSQSYAYEVGRQLDRNAALYACSGASSGDLFTRQWLSNFNPRIQIDQAFTQGTPEIISITVGANDIRWSNLVRKCYSGTCGTELQTRSVELRLAWLQRNLHSALQQIQNRSNNAPPQVILTGYYDPISQNCAAIYPDRITEDEIAWVSGGVQAVNQTLQDTANSYSSFVDFAAVDFSGHDICSTTPWVQGLSDAAPIHPTIEGQQAIAAAVVQAAKAY